MSEQTAEFILSLLKDPMHVHQAMLRGQIATISWRQHCHITGDVPNGEEAQLAEIVRLRAEVERLERRNRMHDTVNRDQAESYEKRLEAVEQKAAELQEYVTDVHVLWLQGQLAGTDIEELMRQHGLNLQHKPTETDLTTKD